MNSKLGTCGEGNKIDMAVEEGVCGTQREGNLSTRRRECMSVLCWGKRGTGARRKWGEVATAGVNIVGAEIRNSIEKSLLLQGANSPHMLLPAKCP